MAGAVAALARALPLQEKDPATPGMEHVLVLDALGSALTESGRYARAQPALERTLGPDPISTGNAVATWRPVIKLTGNFAEAKPLFERSLRIYELRLGPEHPRLAVPTCCSTRSASSRRNRARTIPARPRCCRTWGWCAASWAIGAE